MRARLLGAGLALAAGVLGACQARPRQSAPAPAASSRAAHPEWRGKLLEVDLTGGAPESSDGALFPRPASRTYTGLVRALERARDDADATGVFVRLGDAALGWARTEELSELFAALRKQQKPVVCHAHGLGNSTLWLFAAACDRVWLSPAGEVEAVGLAGQNLYLKSALDRFKVRADMLHMGRYKSAAESLTNEGPSDAARESLTETLGSIRTTWLDATTAARPGAERRSELEHGPWTANEAKARGLVDALGYESDARADAEERATARRTEVLFGSGAGAGSGLSVAELLRALSGADDRDGGRPTIAVLCATGSIAMEGGGLLDGGGITAASLTKTIRRLAKDDAVRAVVLRIDSPGGSALASDLLWHELRELARQKPLVASVGDMAASGGYYLAVAADVIVAPRTSIVGSIGVVGGKIVFDDALRELGVNAATFPASPEPGAGARAAYLSPLMAWDDATRERVRTEMQSIYDLFVDRVAAGRKISIDEVKAVAEGRIWSGAQGKDRKLVDELGGLSRALAIARERGQVSADAPIRVEGAGDSLLDSLGLDGASDERAAAALERLAERRARLYDVVPPALLPTIGALQPLARGERVLAATPFALVPSR